MLHEKSCEILGLEGAVGKQEGLHYCLLFPCTSRVFTMDKVSHCFMQLGPLNLWKSA